MILNLQIAWIWFLLGCIAGIVSGIFFHKSDWLGGYASWRRRMTRLGHISFFGMGFINVLFCLTARTLGIETGLQTASVLLITGAVSMPAVCYLSAYKQPFGNLFFIPALSVSIGVALFVLRILGQ